MLQLAKTSYVPNSHWQGDQLKAAFIFNMKVLKL